MVTTLTMQTLKKQRFQWDGIWGRVGGVQPELPQSRPKHCHLKGKFFNPQRGAAAARNPKSLHRHRHARDTAAPVGSGGERGFPQTHFLRNPRSRRGWSGEERAEPRRGSESFDAGILGGSSRPPCPHLAV